MKSKLTAMLQQQISGVLEKIDENEENEVNDESNGNLEPYP